MPEVLDFEGRRDVGSASWERADPTAALIERVAWNRWHVLLPDGEHTHEVRLERDHGGLTGACMALMDDGKERCPARKYNDPDEPCAHLCTVRKAAFGAIEGDDGEPVRVYDAGDAAVARADAHIEAAMADGGRVVGGGRR
ncbi:hypothetical protein [Haloparvum sedimenti]|uniref:hypothetical protein n=1 Tax=Haloparvum sedimenti TaxID=1678448 RepID=UPI00071E807C|nr:hypothetical protein [Haloparvum sedimenti]